MAAVLNPMSFQLGQFQHLLAEEERIIATKLKNKILKKLNPGGKVRNRNIKGSVPLSEQEFLRLFPDAKKSKTTKRKIDTLLQRNERRRIYTRNFKSVKDQKLAEIFGKEWYLDKHKTQYGCIVKISIFYAKEISRSFETYKDRKRLMEIVPGTLEEREDIVCRFTGKACYGSIWSKEPDVWKKEVEYKIALNSK